MQFLCHNLKSRKKFTFLWQLQKKAYFYTPLTSALFNHRLYSNLPAFLPSQCFAENSNRKHNPPANTPAVVVHYVKAIFKEKRCYMIAQQL
ncbi:hypothetical protein C7N43_27400 [Sphingobacteriales bacterium UPWRP_1]|nr:hypothetical protein BVG80_05250 [Sphingobacteriales bacterium TSM_CSM]PSJ73767.1 hypothetical protein C7N43_27400 [Sphingobacteriales bacterium UPWRP_1]